jgi:hypothetical protein
MPMILKFILLQLLGYIIFYIRHTFVKSNSEAFNLVCEVLVIFVEWLARGLGKYII